MRIVEIKIVSVFNVALYLVYYNRLYLSSAYR